MFFRIPCPGHVQRLFVQIVDGGFWNDRRSPVVADCLVVFGRIAGLLGKFGQGRADTDKFYALECDRLPIGCLDFHDNQSLAFIGQRVEADIDRRTQNGLEPNLKRLVAALQRLWGK